MISSHEKIGFGRERCADHHIVVGIWREARRRKGNNNPSLFHVQVDELTQREERGRYLRLKFGPRQRYGQFFD